MNTAFRKEKSKKFSVSHYRIYVDAMILELPSVKLKRGDT